LPRWPFGSGTQIPCVDLGPARFRVVLFDALAHPEIAVASAKQGCDLLIASEDWLSPKQRLLAGVRTIDNICVAVCALNDAGIWITPEGHNRWEELSAGPGAVCRYALDTNRTRKKIFQVVSEAMFAQVRTHLVSRKPRRDAETMPTVGC
jgi:hypothetical protein